MPSSLCCNLICVWRENQQTSTSCAASVLTSCDVVAGCGRHDGPHRHDPAASGDRHVWLRSYGVLVARQPYCQEAGALHMCRAI